jgi:hypothetical protein
MSLQGFGAELLVQPHLLLELARGAVAAEQEHQPTQE